MIAQANAVKDQILNTPLPGVDQSIAELQTAWGVQLDVRTHVANNSLRTVATTRFSATPKGKSFIGKLRVPQNKCVYAEIHHDLLGHFKFPMGVESINQDLGPKVSNACSTVFAVADLDTSVYRGESPEKKLQSGNAANALPSWTTAGVVKFTGTLADKGHYYECGFSVSSLPTVSIVELKADTALETRLTDYVPSTERVMSLPFGRGQIVLNSELVPYGLNGVLFGGKGPQDVEDCPASHSGGGGGLQKMHDFDYLFDPELCPQCGLRRVVTGDEVIYEITNPGALLTTVNGSTLFQVKPPAVRLPGAKQK
jgi:hypothetical protein